MFNSVNKIHQLKPSLQQLITFIRSHSSNISRRVEQYAQSFSGIFSNSIIVRPFIFTSWKYHIDNPTPSPLCSKSIANCENKKAFRCFDCMEVNTALLCYLCYDCFVQSNHKGHSFLEFESAGGCCDCGDTSLWNENGFCPMHSNKNHQTNISPDMRELFVKELEFVFYLYFMCVENRSEHPQIHEQYGELLFTFVNKLIQLNFQTKILVADLMNSKFNAYPPLSTIQDTILSSIFNLSPSLKILYKLQKFAFEMYPVQSFRPSILCQYFKLTFTNTFTWEHPIKKFNFQYLTCIKIINRLLSSKELLPIQLNPNKVPSDTNTLISIFKKLYEDCNYLHKMKDSKQYFNYHFQLTNACDLAFYRSHSLIREKKQISLDEYYLKFLAISMHHILERKDLLVKSLKELFDFIVDFQDMTYSLAQERAFAMFMMAYLQGSLERLHNEDVVHEILTFLGISTHSAAQILAKLIKKGLKNAIILSKHNNIKPQQNSYENFFFSTYPEKNIPLHLDLIYHKILMLLSRQYFSYWNIAQIVLTEFVSIEKKNEKLQTKEEAMGKLKDQNPQNLISEFSLFFVKMFLQEINQIAVCNMIGIIQSEKISQIYLRIIATYANKFTVKQIKLLCSYFVSNSEVFENTLKEFTIFEYNKIKLTVPTQPIQKLIYMDSLKGYRFFNEIKWEPLQKIDTIIPLQQFPIFNEDIIVIMIKNAESIVSGLSNSPIGSIATKDSMQTLERQLVSLIQTFLLTQNPSIKFFFIESVECLSKYLQTDIINHINILCKERQELICQMEKGEKQREDDQKRKREKIDLKRKEKELVMRKNQQLMLKQYNAKEEAPHQKELCIYCKEDIREDYHLISYVNLTNLISEFFLKEDGRMHIFVTTCGHKVHEECYTKYGEEKQSISKCFLCKKKTNIIIPNIPNSTQTTEQAKQSITTKFLDSIFATLLSQNEEKTQIFNNYFQGQQQGVFLRVILRSTVKQAVYYGLHAFQQFVKYSLQAYQLILASIKMANKAQLLQNISKLQEQVSKSSHPLALIENYAYSILRNELVEQQTLTQPMGLESSFGLQLLKIVRILLSPSQKIPQINNLSIINRESLLRPLPLGVCELHDSMGKCPFCNKLTNWLYYCVLCEWKACNKETAAFHKHSKEEHLEGSVFISAANGKISFVCMGVAKNQDSLYQNPYGQSYTHTDQNSRKNSLKSFRLNVKRYQKIFQEILSHNISNIVG